MITYCKFLLLAGGIILIAGCFSDKIPVGLSAIFAGLMLYGYVVWSECRD
jgi:hypothetical protein